MKQRVHVLCVFFSFICLVWWKHVLDEQEDILVCLYCIFILGKREAVRLHEHCTDVLLVARTPVKWFFIAIKKNSTITPYGRHDRLLLAHNESHEC